MGHLNERRRGKNANNNSREVPYHPEGDVWRLFGYDDAAQKYLTTSFRVKWIRDGSENEQCNNNSSNHNASAIIGAEVRPEVKKLSVPFADDKQVLPVPPFQRQKKPLMPTPFDGNMPDSPFSASRFASPWSAVPQTSPSKPHYTAPHNPPVNPPHNPPHNSPHNPPRQTSDAYSQTIECDIQKLERDLHMANKELAKLRSIFKDLAIVYSGKSL